MMRSLFCYTVPIIPDFLYTIRHQNDKSTSLASTSPLVTPHTPDFAEVAAVDFGFLGADEDDYYYNNPDDYVTNVNTTTPLPTTSTTLSKEQLKEEKEEKHRELVSENTEVGVMFASKAVVQLIANPFVGPLTNKIGYSIPMFMGFVVMFFSTISECV